MPSINLLPWREEQRKKRQRDFGIMLGAGVAAAAAVVLATMFVYNGMISGQQDRNDRLTEEIRILEQSIEEIDNLELQKERLLARMEVINQLQKSRPEIVHLFDEITRQLPDGVFLTSMRQTGNRIELRGTAQSSTRVSALMRQIDASEWLKDPEVESVQTTPVGNARQAEFVVYLRQTRPGAEEEEDQG